MTTVILKRFDPWMEERKFPQKKVHLEIDANLAPRVQDMLRTRQKLPGPWGRAGGVRNEFSSTVSATALGVETYSGKTLRRTTPHSSTLR